MGEDITFFMFLLGPPLAAEMILLWLIFRYSRNRGKKASWGRILLVNLLSILMLVVFAGLGGELYYRYVYDTTDSLSYTKVSQQWEHRYIVFNQAGFRDNVEYHAQPQAGRRRISFLGDSFTAGHGIKNVEDRFPNLIRAHHPEWEIHVLASFGWETGDELEALKLGQEKGYKFDVVVLVYCLNDLTDLSTDWQNAIQDVYADVKQGGWLRQNSFFVDTIYHRYKAAHDSRVSQYFPFIREGYRGPLWEEQKTRLKTLRDFVEANGGQLVVVTFPFVQLEGPNYEYQSVHDQLNQFWRELGVPHLDLQPVFAGESPKKITVSRYDAHPNEYANELAAKKIDQFLTELMAKSPSPPR